MLPPAHIEFTWAAVNLVQMRAGRFKTVDYRLIGLAALLPDLIDKPLALTVYREANAALFWGHNLWFHAAVWLAALAGSSLMRRQGRTQFVQWLPYLLAFSGHLLADRMWGFQESLLYPFVYGYWHPWVHVGEPAAMLEAYVSIIRTTPLLIAFEIGGLALLIGMIVQHRLWCGERLRRFVKTGLLSAAPVGQPAAGERPAADGPVSHLERRRNSCV